MYIKTVRIFFHKTDRTIYTSHLDLMRAMSRALSRSGLPIWYTQGFHPHIYLTFALPLALGVTGLYESMDIRLNEDIPNEEILRSLNMALPEGLRAVSVGEPVMEPKAIMWADYRIFLRCEVLEGRQALEAFSALAEVPTQKRSKKGIKTVDIKPMFEILSINDEQNGLMVTLRCRAGVEVNLNPTLVLEALSEATGFRAHHTQIARFAVWDETLQAFL